MTIDPVDTFVGMEASGPRSFQELAELVQMLAGLGEPYGIEVRNELGALGQVGVARGRVVHARVGELSGMQAFFTIMSWSGAQVTKRARAPQPISIEASMAQLLLDAYWYAENLAMSGDERTIAADDSLATLEVCAPQEAETLESLPAPISLDRERNARAPLAALRELTGFVVAAEIDVDSATPIVVERGSTPFELGAAAIANAGIMKAGAFGALGAIEDVVVTLGDQYHMMRPVPGDPGRYLYLAIERSGANLSLARLALAQACRSRGGREEKSEARA